MATEASLLPLDMSGTMGPSQTSDLLKDDPFLQELINSQGLQGDLLASLLDMPSETLHGGDSHGTVGGTLYLDPLSYFPTSPVGSEGYSTESSSTCHPNGVRSPAASVTSLGGSVYDQQSGGDSPSHSPLMTSSEPAGIISDPSQWSVNNFQASGTPFHSALDSMLSVSPDVKIDVESLRASSVASPPSPDTTILSSSSSSSSSRKAATLVLSDEEKKLLSEEGIALPTDMPLTKAEQKHLKRIQRKIKNKISAQESRKKKKEYVEGLEDRVRMSTEKNQKLTKEVNQLQSENQTIMKQLQELQELVARFLPSKAQAGTAGTILMVMVLSFSFFLVPLTPDGSRRGNQLARARTGHSRSLLFTETDEFGNVIDPNTRKIISVAGGQTPYPLPPWLDQTPVIREWMNRTRLTATAREVLHKVSSSSSAPYPEERGGSEARVKNYKRDDSTL